MKEAADYLKEYQAANKCTRNTATSAVFDAVKWKPPKPGWFKVNTDGATFADIKCCGIGVVVRNERG